MFTRVSKRQNLALVSILLASTAAGEPNETVQSAVAPSDEITWHARLGAGLNVGSLSSEMPRADTGFGGSVSGFLQLTRRLSLGAGFDWERYTYDSANYGDLPATKARYSDQPLTHARVQALLEWDLWARERFTPYFMFGAGYGWENANLDEELCIRALRSGAVLGLGWGLNVALTPLLGIGAEYRINSPPLAPRTCAPVEPAPTARQGTPSFASQRIGLTLNFRH